MQWSGIVPRDRKCSDGTLDRGICDEPRHTEEWRSSRYGRCLLDGLEGEHGAEVGALGAAVGTGEVVAHAPVVFCGDGEAGCDAPEYVGTGEHSVFIFVGTHRVIGEQACLAY